MVQLNAIIAICFIQIIITVTATATTYSNPILDTKSPDPAVLRHGGYYYMSISTDDDSSITLLRSEVLTDFRNATSKVVFRLQPGWFGLWAPEIHAVDGELFIYFCMDDGAEERKRSFVIQAENPANPLGNWSQNAIRMLPDLDDFAIDGTILNHGNGQKYFVWAGIKTGTSLFIAPLINATKVGEPILKLRSPTLPWENIGTPTVEGPYFFYNNSWSFMTFSGGSTWLPTYCMGVMGIAWDKDPMKLSDWWFGPLDPILENNPSEGVYTTGHASFTLSPDGTETWMAYHGTDVTENVINNRTARLEKIGWNATGFPVFPKPHGRNTLLPVPSGQVSPTNSAITFKSSFSFVPMFAMFLLTTIMWT
jgi:GH43 family beta-xylosidase